MPSEVDVMDDPSAKGDTAAAGDKEADDRDVLNVGVAGATGEAIAIVTAKGGRDPYLRFPMQPGGDEIIKTW
jgi:hypothetical protein